MIGDAVACTTDQHLLGEGARWDARRGELLRVDIMDGLVFRDRVDDDGGGDPVRTYEVPGTVGAITPVEGDEGWLLASNPRLCPPVPGRLPARPGRGRPGSDADERCRVRSAGPVLGRPEGS